MERNAQTPSLLLQMLIILVYSTTTNYAVHSDIHCLRSIKESLEDPGQGLSSWDFRNNTEGHICGFVGVECWHPDESKVLNIRIPDMGLGGPFPIGVRNCTSLMGLDLSGNSLTGPIPSNLADLIQYVTTLDLSNNNLSGPIPTSIANLSFVHVLRLDNNQLTGQIPQELSELKHITEFSVSNNRLSGRVPKLTIDPFSLRDGTLNLSESYANNPGLCGAPLSPCQDDLFFSGFAVGLPASTVMTTLFIFCCLPRLSMSNMRSYLSKIKKKKGIKHHLVPQIFGIIFTNTNSTEESKIMTTEKYVRPLSLEQIKLTTNDFDIKNEIGFGKMGLMYKAVFPNGQLAAVKRLHKFESFEKEFLLEIDILGRLRHTNLVQLLSFCFEMGKKFLVYEYMSNGSLHQWLHSRSEVEGMKMGWNLRLRIAVGIARGLSWLHHNNILRVAHLKISSKCILLDDKFEPKISNFGNSNILMNTSGVLSSGNCTFVVPHSSPSPYKEDVYSFGILLLELVSGRERPYAETESLGDDVCGEELNIIDECLIGQGFDEEIYETLRIAKNCIQTHQDGATSMLEVYQAIHAIGISGNEIDVD